MAEVRMPSLKTVAALNTLYDTALHKSNFWCFKPLGLVGWNIHLNTGRTVCTAILLILHARVD